MIATSDDERRPRHHVEMVMGMAVSIDVRDEVAASAIDDVVNWLHHVDATFSTHRIDTPVSRLGMGELALADMPDEVLDVLRRCEELHDETEGAFDVLAVPAPNGSRFDPSGLVKGWSLERAAELLEDHGARNFCINGGGDIALRGAPAPGESWRIGIRHPDERLATAAVIVGAGRLAIATSGSYERGAHIVDPATGEPTADLASVTIVGPELGDVDAYATAVYVMGVDGLTWLTERHPDHAGFVITRDQRTFATPNFAEMLAPPARS
jgi:thiamine biosynthesis lipoprotein